MNWEVRLMSSAIKAAIIMIAVSIALATPEGFIKII